MTSSQFNKLSQERGDCGSCHLAFFHNTATLNPAPPSLWLGRVIDRHSRKRDAIESQGIEEIGWKSHRDSTAKTDAIRIDTDSLTVRKNLIENPGA
ncbi:hypothetical protein BP6252_01883 [Coleophoma cylindrospora]|uniref:Uncharacterized protein n=1 Tax=Coleophoma cylindrospora TaxID=1849047 RepID=A0A3D8SDA9_9HELO|nr:hypothetical protein BP6252_01883 [Coleophoma cylindrospora]